MTEPATGTSPVSGRKVAWSAAAQLLSQAASSVIGVVLLKVMTNDLGPERYGFYATALAFVLAFSLITDLGLTAVTPREIAAEPRRAGEIIADNLGMRLTLCVIGIPLLYGLSFLFYRGPGLSEVRDAILILSGWLIVDSVRQIVAAQLTATMRNPLVALIAIVQQIVLLGLTLVVAHSNLGIAAYCLSYLSAMAVAGAMVVLVVRRRVAVRIRWRPRVWPGIFRMSLAVGLMQLLNLMYLRADSVLISVLRSTTDAGLYAIAYLLLTAFAAVPSYVMSALIPAMVGASGAVVGNLMARVSQYICLLAGLFIVGGVALRNDLVTIVASEQYARAATPFAILLVATSITYLITVFSYAAVSLNKHRRLVYCSLGCLLLNIALNVVFIPLWGINGSAVATGLCELVSLYWVSRVFRGETGVAVPFRTPLIKCLTAAGLALIVTSIIDASFDLPVRAVHFVVLGVAGTATYLVAALIVRAVPSDLRERIPGRRRSNSATG